MPSPVSSKTPVYFSETPMSCRGETSRDCASLKNCKFVSGNKRSYCRTKKNKKNPSRAKSRRCPKGQYKFNDGCKKRHMASIGY